MIWIENFGVKVWNVKPEEKFVELRVSTSSKNKDGTWGASSNWYPVCFGKAAEQAAKFKSGDYVRVKRGFISNEPFEQDGKKRNVFKMKILEFDTPDRDKAPTESTACDGDSDAMPY